MGWLLLLVAVMVSEACASDTLTAPTVRWNTMGFLPKAPKGAVVDGPDSQYWIVGNASGSLVCSLEVKASQVWAPSGESVRYLEFSSLTAPGEYRLLSVSNPKGFLFKIDSSSNVNFLKGLLKAYYYQRASLDLEERFAGSWARKAGHADVEVLVHASAASAARPVGFRLSSSKGWYDAGDYNKYVVNSGISTATLLGIFRSYSGLLKGLSWQIPESGGALPDLLAEARWNLEWMLSMQDSSDGGVYHKLTNLRFDPLDRRPDQCGEPRYVVLKSTAAALDFAAVMAMAYRIYRPYDSSFALLMLAQARQAFAWAEQNPQVFYVQPEDVRTGRYDDANLDDERFWAAAELWLSTGEKPYQTIVRRNWQSARVPDWRNVGALGHISLALAPQSDSLGRKAKRELCGVADFLLAKQERSAYRIAMEKDDFVWGSNAVAANQGMMLAVAHELTGQKKYLDGASMQMDYLLGRNPFGRSFVTGFGVGAPMHPHHRLSISDSVLQPVPGLLVGGPNPGQQDLRSRPDLAYPSVLPALSWLDDAGSYASNEVAINWNAPAAYLAAALSQFGPVN